jgi:hypothetical protein
MQEKFTPGPWEIETMDGAFYIMAGYPAFNICTMQNENHAANAKLIKAAPDMVDVLRAIEQFIENLNDNVMDKGLALKHVKRVLDDATGE